jgi:hypothetical protein
MGGFVGRERELAELRAALQQTILGQGGLVLVSGEPGIGKTRLVEELSASAVNAGSQVLVGRCWESGGAPAYWPWIQALRSLGDVDPTIVARLTGEAPVERGRELADAPSSLGPDGARFQLFDAVGLALDASAKGHPLVILLDDLHAGDTSSLLLLRFLAGSLARSRVLLVGTYREFEAQSSDHADIFGDLVRASVHVPLRGLATDDVSKYIAETAGFDVRASVVDAVHNATEGNPLFMREVVRLLIAEGRLAVADEQPGDPRMRIPDEVRIVIRRRLAALSNEARSTLRLLAVVGRDAQLAVLRRTTNLSLERLLEVIEESRATGLIAEDPQDAGRLRFSHALVRETLYEDLPAAQRLTLHADIGQALEEMYANDLDRHAAELAHHFVEAIPLGYAARASEYASRAGDVAVASFAFEDAAVHYARALHAIDHDEAPDEERRCELLLSSGEAMWRAGRHEQARETFIAAGKLARKLGSAELLAASALGYAGPRFQGFAARTDDLLISLLEESLEALPHEDSRLRVRLLSRLVLELYWGSVDRRISLSEEALQMARRLNDVEAQFVALYSRDWALNGPDTLKERLASGDEIIELATRVGDREMIYLGHQFRATTLMETDDMRALDVEIEACAKLAGELRMPLYRWQVGVFRAMRALFGGAIAEAERLASDAVAMMKDQPSELATVGFGVQMFYVRWLEGHLDELAPGIVAFAEGYPWTPAWGAALAFVYAELGRDVEARAQVASLAGRNLDGLPRDAAWLAAMWCLSFTIAALGDERRAVMVYDALLPYADRTVTAGYMLCMGSVATALGMLAATFGRWDEAEAHFLAAARRDGRMGNKPGLARTLCEYAAMLLRRGRPADMEPALRLLHDAMGYIDACELEGFRARALALREKAEGKAPQPVAAMESEHANAFRLEGDFWTVSFEGKVFRLKDLKGLRYIAHLLRHPRLEVRAVDIVATALGGTATQPTPTAGADAHASGLRTSTRDEAEEILDAEAKAAFKRRLTDLEAELNEAREWGDPGRAERAQIEIEALTQELAKATGLGGRSRSLPSPGERARVAVTKAIKVAIDKVRENSPSLAAHLGASIRTGRVCSYHPPEDGPAWTT